MKTCYFCDGILASDIVVYRSTRCPHCGKDLKICRNCRFFSPDAPNQCLESMAEPVQEKERANFCDWFSFTDTNDRKRGDESRHKDALDAFNKLFS